MEAPTKKLRGFRILDIRQFSKKDQRKLIQLGKQSWKNEKPTDWRCLNHPGKETQRLDEWLLAELGNPISQRQLYGDLVETIRARFSVAKDKKKTIKKKMATDVASIASEIVSAVKREIQGRRFPEDFISSQEAQVFFSFEGHEHLSVESGRLLTNTVLCVKDESSAVLFDKQLPTSVADLIIQALLLGRTTFHAPLSADVAKDVLKHFYDWITIILERVRKGINESALGTGFESKVEAEVLRELNFHELVGQQHLPSKIVI